MLTPDGYRKRIEHSDTPLVVHELTFSCYKQRPLLAMTESYAVLGESLGRAVERHDYELLAFVFMPEHVHLMVKSRQEEYSIAELLYAIKKPFSHRAKCTLEARASPLLAQLTIRERPGKTTFRFWQEGPGYDRDLTSADALVNALRYIHRNPVRRALCARPEDWVWSSFVQYLRPDDEPLHGLPRVRRLRVS